MSEVAKVDAHAARSVAGRIRQGIRDYLAALALVKRAWDEEHWRILGYDSWQEYCDGEFGADRLGLPAAHRDKALHDLRLSGMSVRAISATTGVPKSTVADELTRLSDAGQLEQPDVVRSLDGRDRPATNSPADPATPVVEAPPSQDQSGPDHPSSPGEGPTPGLAVATATAASEVAPVDAVVAGDNVPPVSAGESDAGGTLRAEFAAAFITMRDLIGSLPVTATSDRALELLAGLTHEVRAAIDEIDAAGT